MVGIVKGILQYKGPNGSKFTWAAIGYKNFLVAGGDNCESMHVYDYNSNRPISSYTGFNSDVTWVNFTYDESKILAGTYGGTLFVYNYDRGKVSNTLRGHLTHCRWAVDQKEDMANYIVSGAADTNVKVWDLRQKSAIATYKGHNKAICSVDISPDTQFVASGCTAGIVKIWDLASGKCAHSFDIRQISQTENTFIKHIKFNPADCWMAVACSDKIIRYYDTSTYELINESSPDVHPIGKVDFDPDGEVVIGGYSDSVKVWDLESRRIVSLWNKSARPVLDLKCSDTTDFTFVIENVNGTLGLSQISTSILINKAENNIGHEVEEEKKLDISPAQNNWANQGGAGKLNKDLMNGILDPNPTPLNFYKAPGDKTKLPNGKILNNKHDYALGIEDSNDLENIEENSYQSPEILTKYGRPPSSGQAQLPKKMNK